MSFKNMKRKNHLICETGPPSNGTESKEKLKPNRNNDKKEHSHELINLIWDYYDRRRKGNEKKRDKERE